MSVLFVEGGGALLCRCLVPAGVCTADEMASLSELLDGEIHVETEARGSLGQGFRAEPSSP